MEKKRFKNLFLSLFFLFIGILANPDTVFGQTQIKCSDTEINTAIGCLPFGSMNQLMAFVLRFAIGIGGGIAFVLMVYAGIQILTSSGDPKRVSAGKELLTAAISGLLLIVFSVFLLRFLGVDILRIPGF